MNLWIAAARLDIRMPYAVGLKDRRQVVRSITDGVRGRFSISAADLGPDGSHGEASLGFAAAGSSARELDERLHNLENFLYQREEDGEFEITGFSLEVFNYGDISDRQA